MNAFSKAGRLNRFDPITEINVLWITAGLGCDGDTIAMTAATQPSIEDILLGAMPWIPKVYLHNPFLTFDNGEEFMRHFHQAAEGKLAREHCRQNANSGVLAEPRKRKPG